MLLRYLRRPIPPSPYITRCATCDVEVTEVQPLGDVDLMTAELTTSIVIQQVQPCGHFARDDGMLTYTTPRTTTT